MKEEKISMAEYRPHDLGLVSQRNFGINLANGKQGILSYGIHFNGKDFIDPHSSLTLGRLYGAEFGNPLKGGHGESKKGAWYTLVWCDKQDHHKYEETPWRHRYYDDALGTNVPKLHDELRACVEAALNFGIQFKSDSSKPLGSGYDDSVVQRLDARCCRGDYPKPKHRKAMVEGYDLAIATRGAQSRIRCELEKAQKAIKHTCNLLSRTSSDVSELFYHCMTMRVAIPELRPPAKLMAKVMGKLLLEEGGYSDKDARQVLWMCDIMSDLDKIKEHSTKIV